MSNKTNVLKLKDANASITSVEFSKDFREEYLDITTNPILLKQSILVTNLLFQIILDLKDNMFHTDSSYLYDPNDKTKNQTKLKFWESEVINTDKSVIKKVYRTSSFLKNRNKEKMTEALEFLKNYKKTSYTFTNSEGKVITTSGGLIKDWFYMDKTGLFEITISLYWADKIVRLNKGRWNELKTDIIKEFKDIKQRFFILWVMNLKKYVGTKKKFEDFLNTYELNYPNSYEFMRGFLVPIKTKLDNKEINSDWFSFSYFLDQSNNNNIRIVPYDVKPETENKIPEEFEKAFLNNKNRMHKNNINYKVKYHRRRHQLSQESTKTLKTKYIEKDLEEFNLIYEAFKKFAKEQKMKVTDYQDRVFLEEFDKVAKKYRTSAP